VDIIKPYGIRKWADFCRIARNQKENQFFDDGILTLAERHSLYILNGFEDVWIAAELTLLAMTEPGLRHCEKPQAREGTKQSIKGAFKGDGHIIKKIP
jgi:hypothetical protein